MKVNDYYFNFQGVLFVCVGLCEYTISRVRENRKSEPLERNLNLEKLLIRGYITSDLGDQVNSTIAIEGGKVMMMMMMRSRV